MRYEPLDRAIFRSVPDPASERKARFRLALLALLAAVLFTTLQPQAAQAGGLMEYYGPTRIGKLLGGVQSGVVAAINVDGDVAGWIPARGAEHDPMAYVYLHEGDVILLPWPADAAQPQTLAVSDRSENGTFEVLGLTAQTLFAGEAAVRWEVSYSGGSVLVQQVVKMPAEIVAFPSRFPDLPLPATLFAPENRMGIRGDTRRNGDRVFRYVFGVPGETRERGAVLLTSVDRVSAAGLTHLKAATVSAVGLQ